MKELIRYNIKFIITMIIIIIIGVFGVTYSLKITDFDSIIASINTGTINVNISYANPAEENVTSIGQMYPIEDTEVKYNSTDTRILKSKFYIEGNLSNPNNTIYDIVLYNILMDCELRTSEFKWRLYKNGTLLSEGDMSSNFDALDNNKLVLTNIQEDLTTTKNEYVFMLWLSESCNADIANCTKDLDQSDYLNKTISGEIKIELSTKSKKELDRTTGEKGSCKYIKTNIPTCNNLTYNGTDQQLINEGNNYTLENNIGKNADEYSVTVKLKSGYRWTNSSTEDKTINCSINKRDINIAAKNQKLSSTISFSNNINMVDTDNLINNHTLSSINLTNNNNIIEINSATILDENNIDVTNNYNINYVNGNITYKTTPTITNNIADEIILINGATTYNYSTGSANINLTCKTSDATKATCSINNTTKKITITPLKIGNVIITLETTESENYEAYSINKTIQIVCSRTAVEPEVINRTYNGISQYGILIEGKNITGTGLSAVNAGSYIGTVVPNEGYCWVDGTTTSKQYSWTMNKAASSCTITNNPTLNYPANTSKNLTYTCTGDSSISVNSSNTSIISVSGVSNTSATLTANNAGNATITIAISEGNNYLGSSTNKNINVAYSQYTVSFNSDGGNTISNITVTYHNQYGTLPTPTKSGYEFTGWYDSNNNLITSTSTVSIAANHTLTAHWEKQIELPTGLIPVTISNNGTVVATTTNNSNWANYENKQWGNAVLVKDSGVKTRAQNSVSGTTINSSDILAYFVYIPRFAYKIWATGTGSSPQTIEIVFQSKNEISNGTTVGSYLTHPAFWWDKDSDGVRDSDEELSGIWVGKFETTCPVGSTNGDGCSITAPTILPNSSAVRKRTLKVLYDSAKKINYGIDTSNTDVHLAKNSEYGAYVYLSHSVYGINTEIQRNNRSNYITSCGWNGTTSASSTCTNSYGTVSSYPQSSTGNISGIFDISGGLNEYVMAVFKKTISSSGFSSLPEAKYYNNYTDTNPTKACNGSPCFGHALFETYQWYSDSKSFVSSTSPWLKRGGNTSDTDSAGAFNYYGKTGEAESSHGYRAILIKFG